MEHTIELQSTLDTGAGSMVEMHLQVVGSLGSALSRAVLVLKVLI